MIRAFSVRQLLVLLSVCGVVGWLALIVRLEEQWKRIVALAAGLVLAIVTIVVALFKSLFRRVASAHKIVLSGIVNESMWKQFHQQLQQIKQTQNQSNEPASTTMPLHVEINVCGHHGIEGWRIGLDICRELMKYPGSLHAHVPRTTRSIGTLMALICDEIHLSPDTTLSPCYTPICTNDAISTSALFTAEQEDNLNLLWVQRNRPVIKVDKPIKSILSVVSNTDLKTVDLSTNERSRTFREETIANIRYYFFNPQIFDSEYVFEKDAIVSILSGNTSNTIEKSYGNSSSSANSYQQDYGSREVLGFEKF